MNAHGSGGCGCNAHAPTRFSEPIAELAGVSTYSLARNDADPANSLAVEINGEVDAWTLLCSDGKPCIGIHRSVWMREHCREVAPDTAVVGVDQQGGLVLKSPRAETASCNFCWQ